MTHPADWISEHQIENLIAATSQEFVDFITRKAKEVYGLDTYGYGLIQCPMATDIHYIPSHCNHQKALGVPQCLHCRAFKHQKEKAS